MLQPIQTFFDLLLGSPCPEIIPLVIAISLCYAIIKALFGIAGALWNGARNATKTTDIVYVATIIAILVTKVLEGFQWYTLL